MNVKDIIAAVVAGALAFASWMHHERISKLEATHIQIGDVGRPMICKPIPDMRKRWLCLEVTSND